MTHKVFCSIVIPVYNSSETLLEITDRVDKQFKKIKKSYELIFVDDFSTVPETHEALNKIAQQKINVSVFHLAKNFGQHNALMCGLQRCSGEYVVTMDDDLQHSPDDIPGMIDYLNENDLDLVIGRYDKKKHHLFRNLGSRLNILLTTRDLNIPRDLALTSFKVFRSYLLEHLLEFKQANPSIDYLLLHVTSRVGNCLIEHFARESGKSGYTIRKLVKRLADNVWNHSYWPLKVVSVMGIVFSVVSFFSGSYYLVRYLSGKITVSGFTTIVLLITFFSGCILISLGIIGEYLIRLVQSTFKNPQFIVREEKKHSGRK